MCFKSWGMMSPDGHCKTFDAAANGFVRGEGCGVMILKRLTAAQTAGDPIRAVIRGSAVNQNGPSSNLTTPHGRAQQALIRAALNSLPAFDLNPPTGAVSPSARSLRASS